MKSLHSLPKNAWRVGFYFVYRYQEHCAHRFILPYSWNTVDVQLRHQNLSVLHSVVVVDEGIFPLLVRVLFEFEASLFQSLLGRVVHFDSTSAPAGGQDDGGIDFVEFIFILWETLNWVKAVLTPELDLRRRHLPRPSRLHLLRRRRHRPPPPLPPNPCLCLCQQQEQSWGLRCFPCNNASFGRTRREGMNMTYTDETGLSAEVASVDITFKIAMSRWGFGSEERVGSAGSKSGNMLYASLGAWACWIPTINPVLHTSAFCNRSKVLSSLLSRLRLGQTVPLPPYRSHSASRTAQTTLGTTPSWYWHTPRRAGRSSLAHRPRARTKHACRTVWREIPSFGSPASAQRVGWLFWL